MKRKFLILSFLVILLIIGILTLNFIITDTNKVKASDGEYVTAGSIIYRQRGTKIHPGTNVGRGTDDTLFAKISGYVKYSRLGRDRKQVSVYETK